MKKGSIVRCLSKLHEIRGVLKVDRRFKDMQFEIDELIALLELELKEGTSSEDSADTASSVLKKALWVISVLLNLKGDE